MYKQDQLRQESQFARDIKYLKKFINIHYK